MDFERDIPAKIWFPSGKRWLANNMTGKADVRLCKLGSGWWPVTNQCIRRYFFPSRAKEAKKPKKKNKKTTTTTTETKQNKNKDKEKINNSWSQVKKWVIPLIVGQINFLSTWMKPNQRNCAFSLYNDRENVVKQRKLLSYGTRHRKAL